MSIINFSPYRQYLYSPLSSIHKIHIIFKSCFIILYLLSVPLIPHIMLSCIFAYLLFIYYLPFTSKYNHQCLKQVLIYTILLIVFILGLNNISMKSNKIMTIMLPYLLQKNSNNTLFIINIQTYHISTVLLKTILFIYSTMCTLQILFYTTKLEKIILLFLTKIQVLLQFKHLFYFMFVFSCSLSSQFLHVIMNQIKDTSLSIKIRKINQVSVQYIVYYHALYYFLYQIFHMIENLIYALYNKEITIQKFYLIRI